MKIDRAKLKVSSKRSTPHMSVFRYEGCPINQSCIQMGIGKAIRKCGFFKLKGIVNPECMAQR